MSTLVLSGHRLAHPQPQQESSTTLIARRETAYAVSPARKTFFRIEGVLQPALRPLLPPAVWCGWKRPGSHSL